MKRAVTLLALCLVLSLLNVSVSYAHRSGCHRWHSCPSDTGSYVCGDTGYYSGCGYDSETPDYRAQGNAAGDEFVQTNEAYITSQAKNAGDKSGTFDGGGGRLEDNNPEDTTICEHVNFVNQNSPQEYYDGFMESYTAGCIEKYKEKYADAYDASYKAASAENDTSQSQSDSSTESSSDASSTDWPTFIFWLGLIIAGLWWLSSVL